MRGVSVAPIIERLALLSIPEPMSGCWIWLGTIKRNGYGSIGVKVGGRWETKHAHRVSYECFVGSAPQGHDLDHICRLRCCINPDHLEPVSRSENLRRSPLMNRQQQKSTCPYGHEYSGRNTRGQRICRICLTAASKRSRTRKV